jgi:DNA-binding transcriptional MerR regulator
MTSLTSKPAQTGVQTDIIPKPQQSTALPNRRPMKAKAPVQKAEGAFRTISEVADELSVEQHVLRFWETKFSQIKPLKRGGGRRYYRPEDVELLKNIHHLLYSEGYTIKGVQKLLSATRGNLTARVGASEAVAYADDAPASPLAAAVEKNKDELAAMLDDLKSMRKLIG